MLLPCENTLAFREEIAVTHADIGFAESYAFEFGDPFFGDFTIVTLSEEERKALATALDTDSAYLTADDRYFADSDVIGIIRIRTVTGGPLSLGSHPHDRKYETYYVTSAWENTLAFVREKDLEVCFTSEYTVTDMRYQRYTPRMMHANTKKAVSYVFHSCDNTVQIRLLDSFDGRDVVDAVTRATNPVPAEAWDAWLEASRPVALMTRPGCMVQIILENQKGETKLVTRYLYDTDMPQ